MTSFSQHVTPSKTILGSALNMILQEVRVQSKNGTPSSDNDTTEQTLPLDAELEALSVAVEEFTKHASIRMAELKRQRNRVASRLFQLPDELLSHIFLYLIKNEVPRDLNALLALSSVCTRFNHITRSTPRLWGYLPGGRHPDQLEGQLRCSKGAPLHIRFKTFVEYPELPYMEMVLPHIPRWQSASIIGLPRNYCTRLAAETAPLLETFVMTTFVTPSFTHPVNLFQGHAPRLHHLEIPTLPISWSSPILSGLTFLSILAFDGSAIPTGPQFHSVLSACPELEEIHIIGREADCQAPHFEPFKYNVSLPKLRLLRLLELHPLLTKSILSSIKGTPITLIDISFPNILVREATECLRKAFVDLPPDSIISPIIRCPDSVILDDSTEQLDPGPCLYAGLGKPSENGPRFRCRFDDVATSYILYETIFPEASRTQIKSLTLDSVGDILHWSMDPLPLILTGKMELHDLTLIGYRNKCPFEALTPSRVSGSDGPMVWPVPKMESLTISVVNFTADKLLILLQNRIPDPATMSQLPDAPASLKRLEIGVNELYKTRPFPIQTIDQIASIVGREGLVWEDLQRDPAWTNGHTENGRH
ncbi:hypothetical protein FRC03_009093 [Tulasnella sp. 419]|nr:hypothetical protein FRC03_009093 [Tulasnella sp. 419]